MNWPEAISNVGEAFAVAAGVWAVYWLLVQLSRGPSDDG